MSTASRLSGLLESSQVVPFNDASKMVFISDCHRGDNSWADDLAPNINLLLHALDSYFNEDFDLFELGDGDELWEFDDFEGIKEAHYDLFNILRRFYVGGRFHMLWGNHNRRWKRKRKVERQMTTYFEPRHVIELPLFKKEIEQDGVMTEEVITVHEGLVLEYEPTGDRILLAHGHQGDCLNDGWWWFGRFVVRNIWRGMQSRFGYHDPTSPAKNKNKRKKVEERIIAWCREKGQMVIVGHTHRPEFPGKGDPPYFNDGSCVHPRCITCLEIAGGEIRLVKWQEGVKGINVPMERISERVAGEMVESDMAGLFYVRKIEFAGPRKLVDFFA